VLGLDDSDLGDRTREIAQSLGVKVQPDPSRCAIFLSAAISTTLFATVCPR